MNIFALVFFSFCKYMLYGHTSSKSMDQPGKVANPASWSADKGY